jgi:ABC-type amino acid transport substrate-binding protein
MPRVRHGIAALALVLGAACVPPLDDDVVKNYDPELNLMGRIQDAGVLRVAVEDDAAPWSELEGSSPVGFTVELGRLVGEELGVETEFVTADGGDMIPMVQIGDVVLAFTLVPITERLLLSNGLSDPYWIGHQRLLVPSDSDIAGVDDLNGVDVCSLADPNTGIDITTVNPGVGEVVLETSRQECLTAIQEGDAQAVTGPDVLLLTLAAQDPTLKIVGDQLTTAGYGAVVDQATGGFNTFVDTVLAEIDREQRWAALYDEWLSPVTGDEAPPFPTMTLEEAAALFPTRD